MTAPVCIYSNCDYIQTWISGKGICPASSTHAVSALRRPTWITCPCRSRCGRPGRRAARAAAADAAEYGLAAARTRAPPARPAARDATHPARLPHLRRGRAARWLDRCTQKAPLDFDAIIGHYPSPRMPGAGDVRCTMCSARSTAGAAPETRDDASADARHGDHDSIHAR